MDLAIKCDIKKDDKYNKKNNNELFVVDRDALISKLNDIIKLDQKIIISQNDDIDKKKIRRNKKELYATERSILISKLNNILKLEQNNYALIYDDLVENDELNNFLNDNADYIKKIYSASCWVFYTAHLHGNIKKNEITLMKSIYKDHGYKFASRSKTIMRDNGIKKKCTVIHFIK